MINSILDAENTAVKQIEEIFVNAGWSDGWALRDEEVRSAQEPLFYRNSTPVVASESKVTKKGQTHSLYCIYNISESKIHYANDKPHHFTVTIALTFYYDDPFIFFDNSPHKEYLDALLSELSEKLWIISADSEGGVPSLDNQESYANRKLIFATNTF